MLNMESEFNSPKNLCASVLEKLKVWETESKYDITPTSAIQLPESEDTNFQFQDIPNLSVDSVADSSINLDIPNLIDLVDHRPSLENNFTKGANNQREPEGANLFIKQFIDEPISNVEPVQKFPFLRRGQGTTRYGSKKLIGFTKRKVDATTQKKTMAKNTGPSESLNNFEKLEELVEHSSFISNSSQINDLLQSNDSMSSTPIRAQPKPKKINLQQRFQNSHPTSRSILESLDQQSKHICNSAPQQCNTNSITKCTQKSNKVHFPVQGVEVIEYENESINDTNSAIALEDSDLVTFSDLEGLVDFNMHKVIKSINDHKATTIFDSAKENNPIEPDTAEDAKTLKMLLASKIEYLNKEIEAFRKRNDYLQELTEELQQEKRNCLEIQTKTQEKLKNCHCGQKRQALAPQIKIGKANNQNLISNQLNELLTSMKSVDQDIKDIQHNMPQRPKAKPFCNMKLLSRPNFSTVNRTSTNKEDQTKSAKSETIGSKLVKSPEMSVEAISKTVEAERDPPKPNYFESPKSARGEMFEEASLNENTTRTSPTNMVPSNLSKFHPSSDYKIYDDRTEYSFPNQSVIIKYNDGREIRSFPDGQKETYFPDNSYEIVYADNSTKCVYSDGTDISISLDGTTKTIRLDGSTCIQFPDGQREDHIHGKVQRSYPDGTIKILYPNGKQETRYSNGKIRIKDRHGNLLT